MLYLYTIGMNEFVGEAASKPMVRNRDEDALIDPVGDYMDQADFCLFEYAQVIQGLGGQFSVTHIFQPMYFNKSSLTSVRGLENHDDISMTYRKTREDMRRQNDSTKSKIALPPTKGILTR